MVTTTRERRQALHQEAKRNLEELAEDLQREGMPVHEIERVLEKTIKQKMYAKFKETTSLNHVKHLMDEVMGLKGGADSKSEVIFMEILERANIEFDFQKKIGKYKVDFFIPPDVIIELDGPHHNTPEQEAHDEVRDEWLEEKGYKIHRIGTTTMFLMTTSTIIENVYSWIGREEW